MECWDFELGSWFDYPRRTSRIYSRLMLLDALVLNWLLQIINPSFHGYFKKVIGQGENEEWFFKLQRYFIGLFICLFGVRHLYCVGGELTSEGDLRLIFEVRCTVGATLFEVIQLFLRRWSRMRGGLSRQNNSSLYLFFEYIALQFYSCNAFISYCNY